MTVTNINWDNIMTAVERAEDSFRFKVVLK